MRTAVGLAGALLLAGLLPAPSARAVAPATPEPVRILLLGDSVTVELADGQPEEAERLVGALDGVREAILEGRLLRARVEHGPRAVPAIVSTLESGGVPVASVTTARPSLDDVYLHYTGRDFHAEDEAGGTGAVRR